VPRWLKGVLAAALSLGYIALGVYWVEAEKEVRILCGFIRPGMTAERAVEALETGNLLRYLGTPASGGPDVAQGAVAGDAAPAGPASWSHIDVWSPRTLGTSRCRVTVSEGTVTASVYAAAFRLERVAATVATAGFAFLIVFQLLLAAGAPLGERAWGGRHRILPPALRVASGMAALVCAVAIPVLWQRVGALQVPGGRGVADPTAWGLFLLFAVSAVANALFAGGRERRMGLPLAVLLAAACLLVALAP